jgi:DNA-directed RNA polymerase subunit M/transcription elongation factor TFIIS
MQTSAAIKEPCRKCGKEEVRYYTQQLRGADEGTTIFYTCEGCGYRYAVGSNPRSNSLLTLFYRWNDNN